MSQKQQIPRAVFTAGLLVAVIAAACDAQDANLSPLAPVVAISNDKTTPQGQPDESDTEEVSVRHDVSYRSGNEAWKLDLVLPKQSSEKPRPGIVFVHGGGWRSGDKARGYFTQGAMDFARLGYVCISVNYRLTDEAPFPACIEDVKCAVRWLRAHSKEYNLDPERIGAYGNSAGAHLVALLGLADLHAKLEGDGPFQDQSSLVQAVCCSAPPTDFRNWGREEGTFRGESTLLAGPAETLAERKAWASPVTHVSAAAPPFLIIHGTADQTVPLQQSQSLAQALADANAKDVTLWMLGGEGHGVFSQRPELTILAMEQFFARTLKHSQ